jgi:predicted deacylase
MKVIEEEPRPLKFIPAHQVAYPPREGMVAYWVDPNDPVSALVLAVALLNRIRKEITAARAGALWPSDTPMLSDDFDELSFWIDDAAAAFRARYKHGSDAALQTAE